MTSSVLPPKAVREGRRFPAIEDASHLRVREASTSVLSRSRDSIVNGVDTAS